MNLELLPPPTGDLHGLTRTEVAEKLAMGRNTVVPPSRRSRLKKLLGPFADPMVGLLLVAIPVYAIIGDTTDAIVTAVALIPIVGVGWALERRVEKTLQALKKLTEPTAIVWREDAVSRVPTDELVAGDLVWCDEGDVIPADCALVDSHQFQVDESTLTGESLPADKDTAEQDEVFAGTTVVAGRGWLRVVRTGAQTQLGRISSLVSHVGSEPTPLQSALKKLVLIMAIGASVFCALVVLVEFRNGHSWSDAVIAGISLLIAALPEEFSIVYSLYLALGAWDLSKLNALVRNLPGVETLGSVTVICTDKTGTLTEGKLEVCDVFDLGTSVKNVVTNALLATDNPPFDPLDVALHRYAQEIGADHEIFLEAELVKDWPFDPHKKYVTHIWRFADGRHVIAAKGAFEGILELAPPTLVDEEILENTHAVAAAAGQRLLAIAIGELLEPTFNRTIDEKALRIIGLVAFEDRLKAEVPESIAECAAAGIRVVLITGDHPATAAAIAEKAGMRHRDGSDVTLSTGAALDSARGDQLSEIVRTTDVFARTRPEQKHALVRELISQGEVVAMTGDGVNDAPALRAAHIGVAMGSHGTEVARESATIVLLDDNFATIVKATKNGRRIYDNLARAFDYLIAVHVPLVFLAFVIPLLGYPLLMVPMLLIVFEIVIHPIVSLVFQSEPAAPDIMRRPPRPAGYALSWSALWRPALIGLTVSIAVALVFVGALNVDVPETQARGMGFATLLLAQIPLLVVTRSGAQPLWRGGVQVTRFLVGGVISIALLTIMFLFVPALAEIVKIAPFDVQYWPVIVLAVICSTSWAEIFRGRISQR